MGGCGSWRTLLCLCYALKTTISHAAAFRHSTVSTTHPNRVTHSSLPQTHASTHTHTHCPLTMAMAGRQNSLGLFQSCHLIIKFPTTLERYRCVVRAGCCFALFCCSTSIVGSRVCCCGPPPRPPPAAATAAGRRIALWQWLGFRPACPFDFWPFIYPPRHPAAPPLPPPPSLPLLWFKI